MLIHPNFDPVAISLGPISVHWYGLMYLLAFASAWLLARRRAGFDYTPVQRNNIDDLIFYGALGVVLGGALVFWLSFHVPSISTTSTTETTLGWRSMLMISTSALKSASAFLPPLKIRVFSMSSVLIATGVPRQDPVYTTLRNGGV